MGKRPNECSRRAPFDFAQGKLGRVLLSFFHSRDVLRVVVSAMTVPGWTDAQKELERVAKIVSVVAVESVGAIVDGELCAETDVDAVAVRQVAHVTERVGAYWKDARVSGGIQDQLVAGFFYALPAEVNGVAVRADNRIQPGMIAFCPWPVSLFWPQTKLFDQLLSFPSGRL